MSIEFEPCDINNNFVPRYTGSEYIFNQNLPKGGEPFDEFFILSHVPTPLDVDEMLFNWSRVPPPDEPIEMLQYSKCQMTGQGERKQF